MESPELPLGLVPIGRKLHASRQLAIHPPQLDECCLERLGTINMFARIGERREMFNAKVNTTAPCLVFTGALWKIDLDTDADIPAIRGPGDHGCHNLARQPERFA